MKTIFNFSHPLGSEATEQITAAVGENRIVNIRVQLDLSQPLKPQILNICNTAMSDQQYKPDYIISPSLAAAAVMVDRYFAWPEDDYPPAVTYVPLIRLVMQNGTTPPVFVLSEIVP